MPSASCFSASVTVFAIGPLVPRPSSPRAVARATKLLRRATRPTIPLVRTGGRTGRAIFATTLVVALLSVAEPAAQAQPGPITISPQRGPVGATVTITGSQLTDTSAVSFGGIAATFTVDSNEQVSAIVPPGATNGPIQLDTPDGSVQSDPFVVQPNIVMILTDDQRWDTLSYMPTVESELVGHGVTFTNAFVENPACCPSRELPHRSRFAFHWR